MQYVDHTSPALCIPVMPFPADAFCSERKIPKNCPFPLGFCNPAGRGQSHGHGATCVKKLVKIACVAPEICWRTDRQMHRHTHTHTQTCLSQYFVTAAAGEVTIEVMEYERERA